jgi:hypothetical protein
MTSVAPHRAERGPAVHPGEGLAAARVTHRVGAAQHIHAKATAAGCRAMKSKGEPAQRDIISLIAIPP